MSEEFKSEFITDGLEWSAVATKKMTHYEAEDYAKSVGARLPTMDELEALYKSKPEALKDRYTWSSVVHAVDPGVAWGVNGSNGDVDYVNRGSHYSFRCVRAVPAMTVNPGTKSENRKNSPVFSGGLMYFPDAMMEISRHSKRGNDKHNPGQPMHWAKEKSNDHADCVARHLIDIGPNWDQKDPETGSYHATALAWRALALLQILLEKESKK